MNYRRAHGAVSHFVSSERARNYVRWLRLDIGDERGMSYSQIAEATGLNRSHILDIHNAKYPHVLESTEKTIMAIQRIPRMKIGRRDSTGTHRRIQGMYWLGYTARAQERLMGYDRRSTLRGILRTESVNLETYARVKDVVDKYEFTPCPDEHYARQAKKYARQQGWKHLWAWDEDTIDDPAAKPYDDTNDERRLRVYIDEAVVVQALAGMPHRPLKRGVERTEFIHRALKLGMSIHLIAERASINVDSVIQQRDRLNGKTT